MRDYRQLEATACDYRANTSSAMTPAIFITNPALRVSGARANLVAP